LEPAAGAEPGACLALTARDLRVWIGERRMDDPGALALDRERRPAIHALLLDTSGSMRDKLEPVREAAAAYVEQLQPDLERTIVATFDESFLLAQTATADRDAALDAIRHVRVSGMTSLLDGLYYTIRELATQDARGVVVLLTDGWDTASFHERDEVVAAAEALPGLTIFTVGYQVPAISGMGPTGLASTKRFLQRLAERTDGKFFEVFHAGKLTPVFRAVREILDNEATLTIVDPEPEAPAAPLKVRSTDPRCKVVQLRAQAAGAPAGAIGSIPERQALEPDPRYARLQLLGPAHHKVDAACGAERGWFLEAEPERLHGCMLDLTTEQGALYDPYGWAARVAGNGWITLRTRPFSIPLAARAALPVRPELLLEPLAAHALAVANERPETDPRKRPPEEHARPYHDYPGLCHGQTLFDLRPALARALYRREDYRRWVDAKVRQEAERTLEALKRRYRRDAPDSLSDEQLDTIVRGSDEGRALVARGSAPTAADLERCLAAWLGDVPAFELFRRWELEHIHRLLDSPADEDSERFLAGWRELRRVFYVPSYARILTLLSPVYDPAQDRVGYWRAVLPRPGWFLPRVQGWTKDPELRDLPLDLIPDLPFGYLALRQALHEQPGLQLDRRRVELDYQLLGKAHRQDPVRAFRDAQVTLRFAAIELRARIGAGKGGAEPSIEELHMGHE
ncbi:MAG TPA: VWA domain-containing protein, partial [Candidatus Polarisedimenticolaceae bacterium]|nr:VWA domain-containing protein [Candidatus Polarisedimenticolaceae bacterium]